MSTTPNFIERILIQDRVPSDNPPAGYLYIYSEGGVAKQKDSSGTVTLLANAGGGGLTNFTETLHTSAPNDTVNATQLEVTTGTTNNDFVATPKGTGAFIVGPEPDGTATGGDKRGANAVDLQIGRLSAANVASGLQSFVGGYNSKATAQWSMAFGVSSVATGIYGVALGNGAIASSNGALAVGNFENANSTTASGAQSLAMGSITTTASGNNSVAIQGGSATNNYAVAIGQSAISSGSGSFAGVGCTVSGSRSVAIGGRANGQGHDNNVSGNNSFAFAGEWLTVTGYASGCLAGQSNLASGSHCLTLAGIGGVAEDFRVVQSCGGWNTSGAHQRASVPQGIQTTDATPTALRSSADTAGTRIVLRAGSTYAFTSTTVARTQDGTKQGMWRKQGLIQRTGSTTSIVGSVQTIGSDIGTNAGSPPAGWDVAHSADNTNEALATTVTGEAATTIKWTTDIQYAEVNFP